MKSDGWIWTWELYRKKIFTGSFPAAEGRTVKGTAATSDTYAGRFGKSAVSAGDNLLFFLRYGFPKPEWAGGAFDPSEETGWLLAQPATIHALFITRAAQLCLEQEYILRRLLWQTDNEEMYFKIYVAALMEPSAGLRDKHRFLVQIMEERPEIPVRFVHEAGNDGNCKAWRHCLTVRPSAG